MKTHFLILLSTLVLLSSCGSETPQKQGTGEKTPTTANTENISIKPNLGEVPRVPGAEDRGATQDLPLRTNEEQHTSAPQLAPITGTGVPRPE